MLDFDFFSLKNGMTCSSLEQEISCFHSISQSSFLDFRRKSSPLSIHIFRILYLYRIKKCHTNNENPSFRELKKNEIAIAQVSHSVAGTIYIC